MIAVSPPEYFPGLPYMARVQQADCFVLADTFRHSRRSMQSRSRLRTPQGWQWISVPLKGGQRGRPLEKVRIENRERWLSKHWRAFQYNYRTTPYFEFYEPEVAPFFEREWKRLGALACASVELLARLLGLSTRLVRASALEGHPDTLQAVLGCFDEETLLLPSRAVPERLPATERCILRYEAPAYRQNFEGFEAGLSTVDLLFNCGPGAPELLRQGARLEAEKESGG